jgi:hypothetical protein
LALLRDVAHTAQLADLLECAPMTQFRNVRTHDHALPDDAALDCFERNLASHRKLDSALKAVDLRLQIWGGWAKPRYTELGYPTRSVTEAFNEGGILAKNGVAHAPEWPAEIAACDAQIAVLPYRHMAAVMATYFHLALPVEQRIAVYARLSRYLWRTRGRHLVIVHRQEGGPVGAGAFRQDLDRARWTLRHALQL